jgi:hypothetical protein
MVHSSSSWRTSRSRRPCQSTWRLRSQAVAAAALVSSEMEVVLGGGKEYTAVEAVEAMRPHCSHCSRQSRCSHCSNYDAVEELPLLDGGPRRPARWPEEIWQQRLTASTSTGVDEQGPIWAQRAQIWAPFFLKNDFGCRLGTANTKMIYFLS